MTNVTETPLKHNRPGTSSGSAEAGSNPDRSKVGEKRSAGAQDTLLNYSVPYVHQHIDGKAVTVKAESWLVNYQTKIYKLQGSFT